MLSASAVATKDPRTGDPRIDAFCSGAIPELFHGIAYAQEIWRPDPFDVDIIHEQARACFERILNRATTTPPLRAGRMLLLLGESGSGKTHLMRAFRNLTHSKGLGYCGYLQMTTATHNYGRYLLANLIDSLDQPYFEPEGETSGLVRLANAVLESPHSVMPQEWKELRENAFSDEGLADFIHKLADNIVRDEPFNRLNLNLDLVRALLYLQRNDPRIQKRVIPFLRCEDLSERDRAVLGGIVPLKNEEHPLHLASNLARLMGSLNNAALVVCIDQLEEIYDLDQAPERFRRAMDTAKALAEIPSCIVVISCLEDFYRKLEPLLTRPVIDRLNLDPEPIRLKNERNPREIQALVGKRLQHLYDSREAPCDDGDSTFPFSPAALGRLNNLRTREVIDLCQKYRERCVEAGTLLDFNALLDEVQGKSQKAGTPTSTFPPVEPQILDLEQKWNDFRSTFAGMVPDEEPDLADLLSWAVVQCSQEIDTGHWFASETDSRLLQIEIHEGSNGTKLQRLLAGLCNKNAQGGGLGNQIKEVEDRAGETTIPVIVRSTDFPANPKTVVSKQLGNLITRGGRRVVVEDSDWRTMLALQEFRKQREKQADFARWLKEERPLTGLKSLQKILGLDDLKPNTAATPPAPPELPKPAAPKPVASVVKSAADNGELRIGTTGGRVPQPISLRPQELTQHAAFLGGPGSGKTTIALNIVEQLLLRGTPAVLIDRKGDLCGYARPTFWTAPIDDPALAERRRRFREQVEVKVYTPGNPSGLGLSIPLVPSDMHALPSAERGQVAGYAAFALGSMLGYKDHGQDASRLAILRQAILLLASEPGAVVTLPDLINFIHDEDPALVNAVGHLDPKLFKRLVQDLQTLQLNKSDLLGASGERLHMPALLGRDGATAKTRLSIINTKFLGDNANIEFWVAQLLLELTRWTSRNPSASLQAIFLFDEADMYLPANRRPATKEPMEGLLKRARSAGVGLLLATQSPGDFDYKCRDNVRAWFLGRITQDTSIDKMRPMLAECRGDVASKLPTQETGHFHLVREGDVATLKADRSLLKTEQLPEDEILRLARESGKGSKIHSG